MAEPTLRERLLRAGGYLVGRQVIGTVLGLLGALVITKLVGPVAWGLFAGALAMATLLSTLAMLGTEAWLIRMRDTPPRIVEEQAFSLLVLTSAVASGVLLAVATLAGSLLPEPRYSAPLQTLALVIPFTVLAVPATARLERDLRYRTLVSVEVAASCLFYAVALGLALDDRGVWALVIGYGAQQGARFTGVMLAARFRPRWRWQPRQIREIIRYGTSYSTASWILQGRQLVSPIIVGGFIGAAAVGHVALADRLLVALSVAKKATQRLSMVGLAKVQADSERLRRMHAEATVLQILGTGPFLVLAAMLGPWLIPALLGPEWEPIADVFPLLAATTLVGTLFNLHSQVLFVVKRNRAVIRLRAAQVVLFASGALLLVPPLGLIGYGLADLIRLVAFGLVHRSVKVIFTPSYRQAVPLLVAFLPPMAAPYLGGPWWWIATLVPALVIASIPRVRSESCAHVKTIFAMAMRSRELPT